MFNNITTYFPIMYNENSGFSIGVFRTQSNIYDGAFYENS